MYWCLQGDAQITQAILSAMEFHSSSPDCVDARGDLERALAVAAMYNHVDCMAALLAHFGRQAEHHCKPSIDARRCSGLTALMYAAAFGSKEVSQMPTQQRGLSCTLAFLGLAHWSHRGKPFVAYDMALPVVSVSTDIVHPPL